MKTHKNKHADIYYNISTDIYTLRYNYTKTHTTKLKHIDTWTKLYKTLCKKKKKRGEKEWHKHIQTKKGKHIHNKNHTQTDTKTQTLTHTHTNT